MWKLVKSRIFDGTQKFVPKTKPFKSDKFINPLPKHVREEIKIKNRMWKKYMENRNEVNLRAYNQQRNKVRYLVRQDYKSKQDQIARDCKTNPKRFWKYVNNKFKQREVIGELSYVNNEGKTEKAQTATQKAEVLCNFFLASLSLNQLMNLNP
jgi:hypothetical protein